MHSKNVTWGSAALMLALFLLCTSCDSGSSGPSLDGRDFLLESSEGFEPLSGSTVRLSFDDGELRFSAGCNSSSGPYELRDGHLIVESLGSTEIGCDAGRHAQDLWLGMFMTSEPLLVLEGDELTLTNPEASLVFLDREVADPDRPLVETPWTVDTFIDGGAASNFPGPSSPTLLFAEDGSLEIDTTCNTGSGRYSTSGDQLTLSDVAYTDKACSGAAASIDAEVQAFLNNGTFGFQIEAARLTLRRGDSGLSATTP